MRTAAWVLALILAGAALLSAAPVSALTSEEERFVGTWQGDSGGEAFFLAFSSDGTGNETWPDDPAFDYTFTWYVTAGELRITKDADSSTSRFTYTFSSSDTRLTLKLVGVDYTLSLSKVGASPPPGDTFPLYLCFGACCGSCCVISGIAVIVLATVAAFLVFTGGATAGLLGLRRRGKKRDDGPSPPAAGPHEPA